MPRRTTSKVRKKKKSPRKTTRKVKKGPGLFQSSIEGAMRTLVNVLRAVMPSKETRKGLASKAWHSRSVRRIAGLVGAAMVCVGIALVTQQSLRTEARYQIDPGRFSLNSNVDWAKGSLAERVRSDIENDIRADLADMDLTDAFDVSVQEQISERLKNNHWVRNVLSINRRYPSTADSYAQLIPTLEIRKPILIIVQEERAILVDSDGVILPIDLGCEAQDLSDFKSQLSVPLRTVNGVTGVPPESGQVWNNQQIAAAISMENVIRESSLDAAIQISTIELIGVPPEADAHGRLHYQPGGGVVLIPDASLLPGIRLIWGRPPIHASTLEASPNDKLNKLKTYLDRLEILPGASIDLRKRS